MSAPGVSGAAAVRFHQTGGTWAVETGPGVCRTVERPVLTNQTTPTASPVGGAPDARASRAASPTVHGTLTALYNSAAQARTVNTLPLEQYVADTVPGESPSSWADLGGSGPQGMDWGFQELEAQAVAVRSYVLSDLGGYGGYADTCDLTCQTYRGTEYETATTMAAANDTAGQVMVMPNGQIATTEYSASTGGYTSSCQPAVAVHPRARRRRRRVRPGACNPNHQWTTSVSGATIQSTWPQIGTVHRLERHDRQTRATRTTPATGGWTPSRFEGQRRRSPFPAPSSTSTSRLNSDLFTVTSVSGGTVSIAGQGWGHGIGMGQWGALGYAIGQDHGDGNWTYQQIVNHYYGPAQLTTLADASAQLERRRRRLLDQRHRRRRLQLRQRAVPRQHRRHDG